MTRPADTNPKTAFGRLKPALDKIPPSALVHLGVVMGLGAAKYGPFNWRDSPVSSSVYVAAAERHMLAWRDRQDRDPESRASHLAHVMACCAILIDAEACGTLLDDRPPAGPAADLIAAFTASEAVVIPARSDPRPPGPPAPRSSRRPA